MEQRYPALRFISGLYKVLGVLAAIFGVIGAAVGFFVVAAAASSSPLSGGNAGGAAPILGGLFGAVAILIYGGIVSLSLYALGEGINLLLALEENTRAVAMGPQRPQY